MGTKAQGKITGVTAPFVDIGQKNFETYLGMQHGFLETLKDFNHDWSERANAEVQLASELASKLGAARTALDAATAYQDWMVKRMEMLAEDGRRLLSGRTLDG